MVSESSRAAVLCIISKLYTILLLSSQRNRVHSTRKKKNCLEDMTVMLFRSLGWRRWVFTRPILGGTFFFSAKKRVNYSQKNICILKSAKKRTKRETIKIFYDDVFVLVTKESTFYAVLLEFSVPRGQAKVYISRRGEKWVRWKVIISQTIFLSLYQPPWSSVSRLFLIVSCVCTFFYDSLSSRSFLLIARSCLVEFSFFARFVSITTIWTREKLLSLSTVALAWPKKNE